MQGVWRSYCSKTCVVTHMPRRCDTRCGCQCGGAATHGHAHLLKGPSVKGPALKACTSRLGTPSWSPFKKHISCGSNKRGYSLLVWCNSSRCPQALYCGGHACCRVMVLYGTARHSGHMISSQRLGHAKPHHHIIGGSHSLSAQRLTRWQAIPNTSTARRPAAGPHHTY